MLFHMNRPDHTITEDIQEAILKIPASAWTPAYDADGHRFTCFATSNERRPARRPGAAPPPPGPL
jgi:hypothetical protein